MKKIICAIYGHDNTIELEANTPQQDCYRCGGDINGSSLNVGWQVYRMKSRARGWWVERVFIIKEFLGMSDVPT